MLLNFLKIAVRNLIRQRLYSIINITGLALGLMCGLFIYLVVAHELSFDRYHKKAKNIYRINMGTPNQGDDAFGMGSPVALANLLRTEFTDFENVGTAFKLNPDQTQIEINHEFFREPSLFMADPQLFEIFDFVWLQGNPETSLSGPNKAVITESIAKKYFKGNAVGQTLRINNTDNVTVSGIIKDPPLNTDLPIHIALSLDTRLRDASPESLNRLDAGTNSYYQTFVQMKPGVDLSSLDSKFKRMVEDNAGKEAAEKFIAFQAQPLTTIHFEMGNFNQRVIALSTIRTFSIIGLFIVLIACINFINLASAQGAKRAKEVGVRRTLGSSRWHLMLQFLGETFLIASSAASLAFIFVNQLVIYSGQFVGISLDLAALTTPTTILFIIALILLVTLLAGFYPAFILSRLRPAAVLKSNTIGLTKGISFRRALIAFQFAISQVLIVCTFIVVRQTNYFHSAPLGFNKDAVVTFDIPDANASKLSALRANLLTEPGVRDVSFSLNTPSATINKSWTGFKHPSFPDRKEVELKIVDSTYFRLFEIPILAGTTQNLDIEGTRVVVNQSFLKEIGIDIPERGIGEKIEFYGHPATIVGVVKDFQTVTLHNGMHAVLMIDGTYRAKGSVKVEMANVSKTIDAIGRFWKEAFPGNYFTYAFLDDDLATFYKEEEKISRLLIAFAIVTIGIASMGLFGLITLVTVQREREISIRKILGASISQLATILSRDYVILVAVGGLLAWPVAYYAMQSWLEEFSNRINLSGNWWVFLISTSIALLLAIITVGIQAIKSALGNPADALRRE